tara:strand:+ start:209 stop:481 length:273 start_codon:yes stop_codon:yes gene_type:complete
MVLVSQVQTKEQLEMLELQEVQVVVDHTAKVLAEQVTLHQFLHLKVILVVQEALVNLVLLVVAVVVLELLVQTLQQLLQQVLLDHLFLQV